MADARGQRSAAGARRRLLALALIAAMTSGAVWINRWLRPERVGTQPFPPAGHYGVPRSPGDPPPRLALAFPAHVRLLSLSARDRAKRRATDATPPDRGARPR